MSFTIETSARWRKLPRFTLGGRARRRLLLVAADSILMIAAVATAYALTQGPTDRQPTLASVAAITGLAVMTMLGAMAIGRTYDIDWRRLTGRDLALLLRALFIGSVLFELAVYSGASMGLLLSPDVRTMILEPLLAVLFICGFRASIRLSKDLRVPGSDGTSKKILIAGAGDAGMQVVRALREEVRSGREAVGFVDDDPKKHGLVVHGVPVRGNRFQMSELIQKFRIEELWIAMPSAPGTATRDYVRRAQEAGLKEIKIVPGNSALLTGKVHVGDIRDVQLEELLGRDPVQIDVNEVTGFVRGKTVLVTGAAGSIGSEICRQVARLGPSDLVLMDQDESGVYDLHRELQARVDQVLLHQVIGDVRDADKVERIFESFQPEVVFHAAAYKHVPLMEDHPDQAVKTNVFGTYLLAKTARRWAAEKFVLISTDKAVNPTSIMGATKRAAEVAIRHVGGWGQTEFVAVRFGNVLGSRGSVVPVFQDQIARGGPVTVTHPDMRRYFMTIPEAVLLVLQAGAMGKNGEVLVLDMGEPVKIVDLARQLIILNGFKPDTEIPIVFTGVRPGEKLFEDILSAEEGTSATRFNRVYVAHTTTALSTEQFEHELAVMRQAISTGRRDRIIDGLQQLVKTYARTSRPSSGATVEPVGVAD